MSLDFFDVIFIVIFLFFGIMGFIHGFVDELFGKISYVISIFSAFYFHGMLSPFVLKTINNETAATICAFVLIFIVTFLIVKIIQVIISKIFEGDILKGLDRGLGLLFGVVEGLLIISTVLIVLFGQPWFPVEKLFEKSQIAAVLLPCLQSSIDSFRGLFA